MNNSLGLDFGTRMIKLASAAGSNAEPQIVPLSQESPFLPSCVSLEGSGSIGWNAFRNVQLQPNLHVDDFRNFTIAGSRKLEIDGQSISATDLNEYAIDLLGFDLNQRGAGQHIALAVPDVWPDGGWAFAAGLGAASWKPNVVVRESAAVWRSILGNLPPAGLLISCGYSGLVATKVRLHSEHWTFAGKTCNTRISGRVLREKLASKTAHTVVEAIRYDPREDSDADQSLHDANEQLLIQLCTNDSASAQLIANGRTISVSQAKGQLPELIANCSELWKDFIASLQENIDKCPIYLWGELSQLLPLEEWTREQVGSDCSVSILDLDAVAAGAALLSADISEQGLDKFKYNLGEIGSLDGRWQPADAMRIAHGCVPLINSTPVDASRIACQQVTLEVFDESGPIQRTSYSNEKISVGRNPDCSLSFDQDKYPMVSGDHAIIWNSQTGYVLEDLNSTNGTFLAEEQVFQKTPIEPGAVIRLGLNGPQIRLKQSR